MSGQACGTWRVQFIFLHMKQRVRRRFIIPRMRGLHRSPNAAARFIASNKHQPKTQTQASVGARAVGWMRGGP
jgi:hypothetical protein